METIKKKLKLIIMNKLRNLKIRNKYSNSINVYFILFYLLNLLNLLNIIFI